MMMLQEDCDLELEKKRKLVMGSRSLDNINTVLINDQNMKQAIYKLIEVEVQGMRTEGTYNYMNLDLGIKNKHSLGEKTKMALKKIDRYCQKNNFYRTRIRIRLKQLYNYFNPAMSINMLSVLRLDGNELVMNLYQGIFGREPDDKGLKHNICILENGEMNKYDLFMAMYRSNENVMRKRIKWKLIARLIYKR